MSRGNVELYHQAIDAYNRRDFDAAVALMDDDVEAVSRLVAIEGDYHGHAGLRRWWDNLFEILPDITIEIVDVRDLGHLTLAVGHLRGRGAGSASPFEEKVWQLVDWRDRKIVWWATYVTEADALEAAGLRE